MQGFRYFYLYFVPMLLLYVIQRSLVCVRNVCGTVCSFAVHMQSMRRRERESRRKFYRKVAYLNSEV